MSQQSVIITNGITDVEAKNVSVDGTEQGLVTRPIISGVDADGYAPTVNPLLVAGTNPDGYVQTFAVTPDGYLQVSIAAENDADAGTPGQPVPSMASFVAGRDPSGNLEPFQMTADGYLKVDIVAPINVSVDITNVSGVDGATAPPETLQVGGKDGSGNLQTLSTTSDGYLNVNLITESDADAGTPGGAAPSMVSYVGGNDGYGNIRPIAVTTDGYVKVAIESGSITVSLGNTSGADGSPAPVDTIQVGGVDGYGNLQTLSTTTDGYLNVNIVSETDADAGVPGQPVPSMASFVAGRDPSGNLEPFQMTADGYLKVDIVAPINVSVDITNVSGADGATAPAEALQVGGKDGYGNLQVLSTTPDGYLNVNLITESDADAGIPGSPVPSQASYVAGEDPSGNLKPLQTNADGYLFVALDGNEAVNVSVTNTVLVDLAADSGVDGATAPTETLQIGGKDGSGNLQTLSTTTDGYLNVNLVSETDADAGIPGAVVPSQASFIAGQDPSGNLKALRTDGYGDLKVTPATAVAYKYVNTQNQTFTLKSGAGVFRKVIVGDAGVTASTITFYDNTAGSGTIIGVVNPSNINGQIEFDIAFTTGLTYVTNNKNPGSITITFE